MANEVIPIGTKIEMQSAGRRIIKTEPVAAEIYISQLLQWTDMNQAVIAVPTYQGRLIPLRLEDTYELQFVTSKGLYRCKGKILNRSKTSNNIAVAEVKFTSALEKYQRRQFYRMNCIVPLTFSVLTEVQKDLYKTKKRCLTLEQKLEIDKKIKNQEIKFLKGVMLDISGGGMRFNSESKQKSGDILLLQPALPESLMKRVPLLIGYVISCRRIPNKEPVLYDNRIEFVEISPAEQELIITYIFKEERDRRKRETDLK